MIAVKQTLLDFLNGTKQLVIPIFQRDYAWTANEHCRRLWNDLLQSAAARTPEKKPPEHFVGSVVHASVSGAPGPLPQSLIIDGQQRITTLTLLLLAIRDHIPTASKHYDSVPSPEEIDDYYLRNRHKEDSDYYRLLLRRSDHDALSALVRNRADSIGSSSRVKTNYEWFRAQLATDGTDLSSVWDGIRSLVYVDVSLQAPDDPQMIYETLNSTGLALRTSDLIRNYVLLGVDAERQKSLYERFWQKIEDLYGKELDVLDDFLRDYLDLIQDNVDRTRRGDVYPKFRDYWRRQKDGQGDIESLLDQMLRFAQHHSAYRLGRNVDGLPSAIFTLFERIRRLTTGRGRTPAIAVVRLLNLNRTGGLSSDGLSEALSVIESYLVRRATCGWPSNSYDKVFAMIASEIGPEDPLSDLKASLRRAPSGYGFPSDEQFSRALGGDALYGRTVCRFLLERMENHRRKKERVVASEFTQLTIEHIMPKTINSRSADGQAWIAALEPEWRDVHEAWLDRIGNLTLTEYNVELSNSPFDEKKRMVFSQSPLKLNESIRKHTSWTPVEMRERTDELVAMAKEIWLPL